MAQGIRPGAATWGQFFPAGAAASAGSEDSTRCRAGGSCDCNIFPTAASGGAETEAHAVYPRGPLSCGAVSARNQGLYVDLNPETSLHAGLARSRR
jgi:hypothetical protein